MSKPTVFLSSTFADFAQERKRLIEMLPYIEVHVSCAERAGIRRGPLSDMLEKLIDDCDLIVLLVGSRAGTISDTGERWTSREVKYALSKQKPVLAYVRETPKSLLNLVDRNEDGQKALAELLDTVTTRMTKVQPFRLGECCKLTAMVIRDVDRLIQELKAEREKDSYYKGFA